MTEINLKYGEYVQLDNMTGKYLIHRLDGSTEDIGSDGRMRLVYEAITEEKTMENVLDGQNGCCPVCAAMPGANIDCDLCMMWSMYNDGRKEND